MEFKMMFLILVGVLCWGEVKSIDVEGQLTVIRNDCYERLAIGERLNPKKVYKKFDYNTVADCEMECTKDRETCRAFSIGIGIKGNGTCELSKEPIRETADLRPIGTIPETDYDLYIKKLDCQLVLEKPNFSGDHQHKPSFNVARPPYDEEKVHHVNDGGSTGYHQNAVQYGHDQMEPHFGPDKDYHAFHGDRDRPVRPGHQDGYSYPKPIQSLPKPYFPNRRPTTSENTHQVQTMVSIASGPQSILHPVHDIIVSNGQPNRPDFGLGNTNNYGKPVHNSPTGPNSLPNGHNRPNPPTQQPDHHYKPPNELTYGDHNFPPYEDRPTQGNPYDKPPNKKKPPLAPLPLERPYGHPVNSYGKPIHPIEEFYDEKRKPLSHGNGYGNERPTYNQHEPQRPELMWGGGSYGTGHDSGGQFHQYGGGYNYDKPPIAPYPPLHQNKPQFDERPHYFHPASPYDGEGVQFTSTNRRKYDLYEAESHRFTIFPPRRQGPEQNFYDHYEKPFPDRPTRYGSLIPHPNDYDKKSQYYDKTQYYDYLFKSGYGDQYEIDLKLLPDERRKNKIPYEKDTVKNVTSHDKGDKHSNKDNTYDKTDAKKNNGNQHNSIDSHGVDKKGQGGITSIITVIDKGNS